MAANLLGRLLEGCGLSENLVGDGRVVAVKTEEYIFRRYPFLANGGIPVLDISDFRRDGGVGARKLAARRVRDAVAAFSQPGSQDIRAIVFDASEGWFATTALYSVRQRYPQVKLIGLQHGLMELTGPESRTPVRRLRRWITRVQYRTFGATLIGAGFGNNRFDAYACFGAWYEEYIQRLNPSCTIVRAFAELSGLTERPRDPTANGYDLVFLTQDLTTYGIREGDRLQRQIIERMGRVAERLKWRIAVKTHPKHSLELDGTGSGTRFDVIRSGTVAATLSPGRTIVVSFNSTGLFEAAFLDCPIVVVRLPRVGQKWYAMFEACVPLPEFLSGWDGDRFSRVRPGVMD